MRREIIRREYLVMLGDKVIHRLSSRKSAHDWATSFNETPVEGVSLPLAYVKPLYVYKGFDHESKSTAS